MSEKSQPSRRAPISRLSRRLAERNLPPRKLGIREVRLGQPAVLEIRLCQAGRAEIGPEQLGFPEVRLGKIAAAQVGMGEIRLDKRGAAQIGLAQIDPLQVHIRENRAREIRPVAPLF